MDRQYNKIITLLMLLGFKKFYHGVSVDFYNQLSSDEVYSVPGWWSPVKAHSFVKRKLSERLDEDERLFLITFERVF